MPTSKFEDFAPLCSVITIHDGQLRRIFSFCGLIYVYFMTWEVRGVMRGGGGRGGAGGDQL